MADDNAARTAILDEPAVLDSPPQRAPDLPPQLAPVATPPLEADLRRLSILGVPITDVTRTQALALVEQMIAEYAGRVHRVFFVNAHTLNLAVADPDFRRVLLAADHVFGDGTGVRWAARLQGVRVRDNLVGTDLVPALLRKTAGRGYRYFMLGSDPQTVAEAARYAEREFPGWVQAGYHDGYLTDAAKTAAAIRQINRSRPDVLLVGMGNPRQEQWIEAHRHELDVPVCLGIGGLFDYWAGNVSRAPQWLRRLGHEWIWRLWQQPADKARRYLLGNPLFLVRILREALRRRRAGSQ